MSDETKQENKTIRTEFLDRTLGFVIGALGLVAGLAWNDAIKALIEYIFPLGKDNILAKFVYAALVTLVVVMLTIFLARWLKPSDKK